MGAQTQREARPQVGRPNATPGTSARCAPQRGSATQMQGTSATQGTSARPQVGRPNAGPQRKCKARPQRKARLHVRKLGAPTQRKARPQDGRPNAKLIRNENVHTREH
jgi:hypothetical protein